jgi:hypothetical protein
LRWRAFFRSLLFATALSAIYAVEFYNGFLLSSVFD